MKNPYELLNVSQNASKQEIAKALQSAIRENMKTKKYTPQELMLAQKQLLDPAKRLAADFVYPAKFQVKRAAKIETNISLQNIDIKSIDENAYNNI